ncbi:hypothetical protein [Amycolatopsis albispora]|uniref:Uncharacterized protein n=1 Tax=Amycolatopsis albispora TaxID=1804986 RepID=A0A344LGZ7_9PSEU|nr:hypothetical protein [Amycolatopsis albispora]AXB47321.1 hypothetical protein A4R43_36750 [Amycolatopsis albispora]
MAVHRRGAERPESRPPSRYLGPLLVTIDDLRALRDLLTEMGEAPVIEFSGGTIDTPDDLRELSDSELLHITVKTAGVEITLSKQGARAVGQGNLVYAVHESWARTRQSSLGKSRRWWAKYWGLLIAGISVVAGFTGTTLEWLPSDAQAAPWVFAVMFGVSGGMIAYGYSQMPMPTVVVPTTLDEFRKNRTLANRHWQTIAIAAIAACIALAGVLVAVLVKK